jgi:ABC-type uncharacterized transport system involved in gliding motility auxiliary subunit
MPSLTESTKAVLRRLDSPLEIRFYSILDPATVPNALPAFSRRVERLLAAYQQEASSKINLTRFNAESASGAKAASEDGIKAFNLEKGEACYLGVALVLKSHKETLPELAPDWEPALESDLSHAIARLVEMTQPSKPIAGAAQADAAAAEEVKRAIPNVESVSLEEGKRILREAALKEFKTAAAEIEQQLKDAQQRLNQAQNSGSATEQQAALKNLQKVQADQTERLQQIAARSKAQIQALEQLKAGSR